MITFVVALAAFAAGICFAVFPFKAEVRRITRALVFRQANSSTHLTSNSTDHDLGELVQAVNTQLDTMHQDQLGRAREKREFQRQLTSFSHDVRTPLMGAKGYLQLALDESDRKSRTRYLQASQARIDDVHSLLDQLHAYTQSVDPEAEFDIRNIQIMPIIANVLYGFYPVFEERHWEPQVDFENEGFFAPCDERAMKRIFDNLVSNVLKYGTSSLSVTQRGRSIWFANRIDRADTIDVKRVFERFYQVDASRGEEGSGLGLAVVANLAQAMNLKVSAEVNDDEFRIRIDFPLSS